MPPPLTAKIKQVSATQPRQTMRGHTRSVTGAVHLPDGRHIITCSFDGSLRLWNLEIGVQIGDDWCDDGDEAYVWSIALSPNGKTVASASDEKIRLWDVETKKLVARWTGHTDVVKSLCWSADGERVVSGSEDRMIRIWDVESGDTVLGPIESGYLWVSAVNYSPDTTKIAIGGGYMSGLTIWDAKTCEVLSTIKTNNQVGSIAWTSDQKKLIFADRDWIRILDTTTWQQIAVLKGHTDFLYELSLFQNDRLLASASQDKTARLWNLDTYLPVGPPIQHEDAVHCAAISANGKLLVTGCGDKNAYVWDIHTTLKDAGLEELLSIPDVSPDGFKQKVTTRKSLVDTEATRRPAKHEYAYRLPPRFFDDVRDGVQSSATPVTHPEHRLRGFTPFSVFRGNPLPSLLRSSQPNTHEATALQPLPRWSVFSRHRTRVVEVATSQDRRPVYVAPQQRSPDGNGKDTQQQQGQSGTQAQASTSQTPPAVASTSATLPPVNSMTTADAVGTQSQPAATSKNPPWWVRLVFFVCCAPKGR